MSVAGYIGKNCPAPLKGMTGVKAPRIPGEDDKKEDAELKSIERERKTEAYGSLEDYDPVLRAHCRL
jgi:hypothetical protein